MGFVWHSEGISMMFYDIPMGFLKEFYRILKGFLCGSYAISMFL